MAYSLDLLCLINFNLSGVLLEHSTAAGYATADGDLFRIPKEIWSHAGLESGITNTAKEIVLYQRNQFKQQFTEMKMKLMEDQKLLYVLGPAGTGKSCCAFAFATSQDVRSQRRITWIHVDFNGVCSVVEFERGTKTCWALNGSDFHVLNSILGRPQTEKEHIVFFDGYTVLHKGFLTVLIIWREVNRETRRLAIITSMHSRKARLKVDCLSRYNADDIFVYSWTKEEYKVALQNSEFRACVFKNLDADLVPCLTKTGLLKPKTGSTSTVSESTSLDEMVEAKYRIAGMSCRYMFGHRTEVVITEILKLSEELEDPIPYLNGSIGENANPAVSGLFAKVPDSESFSIISSFAASSIAMRIGPDNIRKLAKNALAVRNPSIDGDMLEMCICKNEKDWTDFECQKIQ